MPARLRRRCRQFRRRIFRSPIRTHESRTWSGRSGRIHPTATKAMTPLAGHSVFLLFVQLALLLAVARAGAEIAKRFGLPAVVGELGSGIALGPTLFGHVFPSSFLSVFPE